MVSSAHTIRSCDEYSGIETIMLKKRAQMSELERKIDCPPCTVWINGPAMPLPKTSCCFFDEYSAGNLKPFNWCVYFMTALNIERKVLT
mmetsp:Transcript_54434/g.113695  ORF Transcript_54434/g.113695 Transcript_54434/m.113695 type:complete len:89 (+) Transcript_54434:138-404(+)